MIIKFIYLFIKLKFTTTLSTLITFISFCLFLDPAGNKDVI